ncbi:MAG: hypothetical protein IJ262_03625 [Clostridia bacterium]|nr:hypothetical protein [Clostridia bacterium]
MKKTAIFALVLLLLAVFVSCNDEKIEETTNNTLPVATTVGSYATEETTAAPTTENVAPTYILTTHYGETMPTVVTTEFNLANEQAIQIVNPTSPDISFSVPEMSAPQVVSSSIPTTKPTTSKTTTAEPQTEVEETTAKESSRRAVSISSYSVASNNDIVISVELQGWNGGIRTGKITFVNVILDGEKKTVSGYVNGSDDGTGCATVTVYTNKISPASDSSIEITVPAGSIKSKAGDQSNMAFSISTTISGTGEGEDSEATQSATSTTKSETTAPSSESSVAETN